MSTALGIVLCIIVFLIGFFIGMFISMKKLKKQLIKKPPVSRKQIAKLMTEMGRKPSVQQLNHMMKNLTNTNKKINK